MFIIDKTMAKKILFFIIMIFSFSLCTQKQAFVSYTPAEFEKLLRGDKSVQLVDVRRPEEFSEGHIENAVLINVLDSSTFIIKAEAMLDKQKPVAVYCRSGKRSKDAAKKLSHKGFKVYDLDTGFLGWTSYKISD
jgi:Rhodanese-related sulfurtransferase